MELLKVSREALKLNSSELLSRLYLDFQNAQFQEQGFQQRLFFRSSRALIDFLNNWVD